MSNLAQQRRTMVESQIRPSDVTDRRVLRAMLEVPREEFVPAAARALAYMDESLAISAPGAGRAARYLLAPRVLAKLMQAMDLGERDRVLDVGCGTGYATALLARIAAKVVALEADPGLAAQATRTLAGLAPGLVEVVTGPLAAGHPAEAPYDGILVNGAVEQVPPALLDQLKDGGRLVAVVTDTGLGRAMQWRRFAGTFDARALFDAGAPALPGFEREAAFVF